MRKKQSNIILLLAIIAGIAMLLGTNVMAYDIPEACTGGKYDLNFIEGPITLDGPGPIGPFDYVTCESYPCYFWHYAVEGKDKDLQLLTAVTIYFENHPDNPIEVLGGADSNAYYNCDESRINSWGEGICNGKVVQFNSQQMVQGPGSRDLYFTVDKGESGDGSAAFHSGNTGGKVDNCIATDGGTIIGGIKAPGYGTGSYDVIAAESIFETNGKQYKILRNSKTGCGYGVQVKNGTQWVDQNPVTDRPTVNGEPIQSGGLTTGNLGQTCKEFRFTAAGSPGYIWVYLPYDWYKIPY